MEEQGYDMDPSVLYQDFPFWKKKTAAITMNCGEGIVVE
jgi:hypothetical protein